MTEPKQPQPPLDEDPTMTANALKAMAHPLRWKILCTLGDREMSVGEMLDKHPERVIELAVRRMMPKTKLGRQMMKKLKVYTGPDHPHAAQKPEELQLD